MNRDREEQLLDIIGDADESYIKEYIDAQTKKRRRHTGMRFGILPAAAAVALLFGTVGLAAVPVIGHFLTNLTHERNAVLQNFDRIEAQYAVSVGGAQECDGVIGTLNSALLEDHFLLLNYTFDWSGLKEAQDGSFHTWFLPWFFYITEGDTVICRSEYTRDLHTQVYDGGTDEDDTQATYIYCIDLEDGVTGQNLVGRELTVQLLYAQDGDGFTDTFTPASCFPDRSWEIGRTYEFGEHLITLNRVRESALYVTLFIDCATVGHTWDEYTFILSDELGNDYTPYGYGDSDTDGYWFTKPESVGARLTLKVVRSKSVRDPYGQFIDDSYEVLYEIPVELKD